MWRSAARSIGACLALLCFFAVSSADPSPPSRADVTSGVRVAQRLIDTIPSPWRLDGDVRMAGDDAPVAQGNFVQASYALNKASLDSVATFSRASNAMQFDSSGYLTYGPNNLLTYSNDFITGWTASNTGTGAVPTINSSAVLDPVGGTNARRLQASRGASNTTADRSVVVQSAASAAAGNYIQAIWVKSNTGLSQTLSLFDSGSGGTLAFTATTTWTQIYTKRASSGASDFQIGTRGGSYGGDQSIDVLIYAATFSAVTYETTPRAQDQVITTSAAYYGPRFDYTYNGSSWVPAGLLVEGAATNLYLQSNDLTNVATSTSGATKSTDGTLGPDGVSLMAKMLANAGGGTKEWYRASTVVSGTVYTASTFVKKGNHRYVFVTYEVTNGLNGIIAIFDLDNPSAATQTFATGGGALTTYGIINEGGGIYRIYVTGSVTGAGTTGYMLAGLLGAASGNPTTSTEFGFAAAGTEYDYFFGAQFEAGNLSSYTPTAASAVTRAAETVQLTGPAASALQAAQGSVVVQVTDQSIGYSSTGGVVLGGSSTYWLDLANGNMYSNSASHLLSTANAVAAGSPYRAGVAWNASGRSLAMNGGAVVSDAFGGWASTTPYLGSLSGTANFANAHFASLAFYNSRLPDATLQTKSVVGASYQ